MDTDGHLSRGRYAEFCSTNQRLAEGVLELVRSLGMKPVLYEDRARLSGRDCGPRFRVHFTATSQVFRLRRKADAWRDCAARRTATLHRRIVSVDPVASVPVRCIQVDSPSHLFLAGEAMVPTHNTYSAVNEIAKFAWENPGNASVNVSCWVAPTYNQAQKALNVFRTYFGDAIEGARLAQGQMQITWKNGSVTLFWSAERYDNLRGEGIKFMVIDEAAMVPKAAWTEVLRPMLTDTMGRAVLISTPRGKNWFYEMYQRGLDERHPDYESFSFPTWESPYIQQSEVDEARETLPEDVFAQEYAGAFLEEAAGVFHGIDRCVFGELEGHNVKHRYCLGWDIAKSQDFSVVTVMDIDHWFESEQRIAPHVASFQRFNSLRYDFQIDKVQATAWEYDAFVLFDSTGVGEPIYDEMVKRGIPCAPYSFNMRSKQALVQNLSLGIQTADLSFPDIPILRSELDAFRYEMSPSGNMIYGAPDGDHDDTVYSLALAYWAAQHPVWAKEIVVAEEYEEELISPI